MLLILFFVMFFIYFVLISFMFLIPDDTIIKIQNGKVRRRKDSVVFHFNYKIFCQR